MKKRLLTLLLASVMLLALTACPADSGGGNDTLATTPAGDVTTTGDGDATGDATDAAATTAGGGDTPSAGATNNYTGPTEAKDFNFLVMSFICKEFEVGPGSNFCIGNSIGDELPKRNNESNDIISLLYQQTANTDGDGASRNPNGFLVSENGEFWWNISHITASFILEDVGSEFGCVPSDFTYIQPYMQMGGGPGVGPRWDWWSPNDPSINLMYVDGNPEGEMLSDFGSGNVLTVTWDINAFYAAFGETEAIAGDTSGDDWKPGNGLQKFGIQTGRSTDNFDAYDSTIKLKVSWYDVEIFVHDIDIFMDFVAIASDLTGEAWDDSLKVTQV
ncbi:MAG: hypothetical protein FWD34_01020 [Oscillospiraceae bacterium]|nr:hypothetical protein [Oscillospiraceae bacterium]